jgi:hypothetical protein
MERHPTPRPTAIYILTIRQNSTGYVRRKSYRLSKERADYFATMLNVAQNDYTLLSIEPD